METNNQETLSPEERIKQLEREKRELRAKLMHGREEMKREKREKRESIESHNSSVRETITKILKAIYLYNKLSKTRRSQSNIFQEIIDIININQKEENQNG